MVHGLARARRLAAVVALATASCGSPQHVEDWQRGLASNCGVVHVLHAGDEVEGRIERITDGWALALHMRLRIEPGAPLLDITGLGRIVRSGGEMRCEVVEASGAPGAPRFDPAVCLDEFESLEDLLSDAQASVAPGQTVVQEVRLRVRHRRRARSRVTAGANASFQERAEVARDATGRVVHVVRSDGQGAREEITVNYPPGIPGRCLALD